MVMTWLNAARYSGLPRAGGGPGRNWSPDVSSQGLTEAQCGTAAAPPVRPLSAASGRVREDWWECKQEGLLAPLNRPRCDPVITAEAAAAPVAMPSIMACAPTPNQIRLFW